MEDEEERERERAKSFVYDVRVCDRVNVKSKVMLNLLPTEFPDAFLLYATYSLVQS